MNLSRSPYNLLLLPVCLWTASVAGCLAPVPPTGEEGEGPGPSGEQQGAEGQPAPEGLAPGPAIACEMDCTFEVVAEYPHDKDAFTQGLVWHEGFLYEGTGLRGGQSSLRKVHLQTGEVMQITRFDDPSLFGEGVTIFGDRIIQLTWLANRGFVYDKETFALLEEFEYPTQGWGLTHDGSRLIMSDGTARLYFLDPDTYERLGSITVLDAGQPVDQLNELEYIDGVVWANVWQTDRIARIDPVTGEVLGWVDLEGLWRPFYLTPGQKVLNGIAYDAANDRLFVTGKNWPKLFEIRVVPAR